MKTLEFMIVALIILGLSLLIATFIVFISMTLKDIWKETNEEEQEYLESMRRNHE